VEPVEVSDPAMFDGELVMTRLSVAPEPLLIWTLLPLPIENFLPVDDGARTGLGDGERVARGADGAAARDDLAAAGQLTVGEGRHRRHKKQIGEQHRPQRPQTAPLIPTDPVHEIPLP